MFKQIVAFINSIWTVAVGEGDAISNLSLLSLATGAILVISSFLRFTTLDRGQLCVGFGFLLLGVAGLTRIADAPPGPPDTDKVVPDHAPIPSVDSTAIERLRLPWDSEERQAKWPVCETLAMLSDIAYRPPVEAEEEISRLGFSGIMPLVENSMMGYVVWDGETVVIVFRGTNQYEAADWAVNFRDKTVGTSEGGIHTGFWFAYQSLKPQVLKVLGKIKPKHLWITGHSLGGAMALACAIDLSLYEHMTFDGLVTFGQPRVVRTDLAQHVDTAFVGRYARFVVGDDIVARIPPSKAFCGSLVWFTKGQMQRSRPLRQEYGASADAAASGEWAELTPLTAKEFSEWQNSRREAVKAPEALPDEPSYQGNSPYIEDHDMARYIREIQIHLGIEPR
jgi:triacylglycerol lipase